MQKRKCLFGFSSLVLWLLMLQTALAGVVADRSRIIFAASDREQGLSLVNINDYPVMVQLWVDDGDPDSGPETANAPILPYPGLLQIAPKERKHINLLNIAEQEPEKQEQLYWLNVYEVPPTPAKNIDETEGQLLIVALRTQMKVFVRPNKLAIDVLDLAKWQSFILKDNMLSIENKSPYYVTYQNLSLSFKGRDYAIFQGMLAPYSAETVTITESELIDQLGLILKAEYIDDEGNAQPLALTVN
ncbi:MAG TPA: molecular chaperone [Shewanella sp.]|nr:molecular chaperone [Shewanella sp.]